MSIQVQKVYVGLGSNLDNPSQQINDAVVSLRELPNTHYLKDSGLFVSKAMMLPNDDSVKPDYVNAVSLLETQLEPLEFLDCLQTIENKQGRVRDEKWGSRTLDLDILLFGNLQINSDRLQVPHPGLIEREFVLYPLKNITQDLDIPGHGKLTQCIKNCAQNGLTYLGSIGSAE